MDGQRRNLHFGLLDVPHSDIPDQGTSAWRTVPSFRGVRGLSSHATQSLNSGAQGADDASRGGDQEGRGNATGVQNSGSPPHRPIRPQARPAASGDGQSAGAAVDRRVSGLSGMTLGRVEGSATSDELNEGSQPRLVPRKGPDLRNEGGGKIDEYLMRLLRNGLPAQATKPEEKGKQPWGGSRLGPLAPGAGKSSSMGVFQRDPAKAGAFAAVAGKGRIGKIRTENSRGDLERLAGPSPASLQSNEAPSASDSATPQPEGRNPSTPMARIMANGGEGSGRLTSGRGSNAAAPSNRGSGVGPRQSNLGRSAKAALGGRRWEAVRAQMTRQSGEFQHHLEELHRMVNLQNQRQNQAASGAPLPLHMTSCLPRPPPLFHGQTEGPLAASQPPAHAWWLNQPGLALGGASSLPAGNNILPIPAVAHKQKSEPGAGHISRTTRMALDAQRRRTQARNVRSRSGAAKGAPPKPTQGGGDNPAPAAGEGSRPGKRAKAQELAGEDVTIQPRNGDEAPKGEGDRSKATWFEQMQPYLQPQGAAPPQGAAGQEGPAAGLMGPPPPPKQQNFDPLGAWYNFHFGQSGRGGPPFTARHLAGMSMSAPEEDWETQCHDYFAFSMQGTSSCNTGQPHFTGEMVQQMMQGGVRSNPSHNQERSTSNAPRIC